MQPLAELKARPVPPEELERPEVSLKTLESGTVVVTVPLGQMVARDVIPRARIHSRPSTS